MNGYVPGSISIGTSWVTAYSWDPPIIFKFRVKNEKGITDLANLASFKFLEGYRPFERSRRLVQDGLDILGVFVLLFETRAFTLIK
jgi:hypothetical protein